MDMIFGFFRLEKAYESTSARTTMPSIDKLTKRIDSARNDDDTNSFDMHKLFSLKID